MMGVGIYLAPDRFLCHMSKRHIMPTLCIAIIVMRFIVLKTRNVGMKMCTPEKSTNTDAIIVNDGKCENVISIDIRNYHVQRILITLLNAFIVAKRLLAFLSLFAT